MDNLAMQALRMNTFDVAAASLKRGPTCSMAKVLREIKVYAYKINLHTG